MLYPQMLCLLIVRQLLTTTIDNYSDKLWCSCGSHDDGRLMLCCDKQTVGYCVWYHYDCVGLSLSDGLQLGTSQDGFVCPHCAAADSDTRSAASCAPVRIPPQQ